MIKGLEVVFSLYIYDEKTRKRAKDVEPITGTERAIGSDEQDAAYEILNKLYGGEGEFSEPTLDLSLDERGNRVYRSMLKLDHDDRDLRAILTLTDSKGLVWSNLSEDWES